MFLFLLFLKGKIQFQFKAQNPYHFCKSTATRSTFHGFSECVSGMIGTNSIGSYFFMQRVCELQFLQHGFFCVFLKICLLQFSLKYYVALGIQVENICLTWPLLWASGLGFYHRKKSLQRNSGGPLKIALKRSHFTTSHLVRFA